MGGRTKSKSSSETISISDISIDSSHVRKSSQDCSAMKDTIADVGLLQPILVRRAENKYVVIDGGRRLKSLKELGVTELIVGRDIIVDVDETDADARFKQVIANIQREDLNDIELGQAFVSLKEEYEYQYNEIADIIGKTAHFVAAKVGLAKRLVPEVQELFLKDIELEKCAAEGQGLDDDGRMSYVMNINVVEDIARLPPELQLAAYQTVSLKEMDKGKALEYLRSIKRDADILVMADDVKGMAESYADGETGEPGRELKRHLSKLHKDVDRLSTTIKSGKPLGETEVIAELETLIERLSTLYAEVKAKEAEGQKA